MPILVTGTAGFIGFHLSALLLAQGHSVVGLDNLNDYYDPALKQDRLKILCRQSNFKFVRLNLIENEQLDKLFAAEKFSQVVHLAAQAGVRYSILSPRTYIQSNLVGFFNILEACRQFPVEHLLFASSSSVYGLNSRLPFSDRDHTDHPVSLYAATKKSNEVLAHSYSHLFNIPCTGLRFFTVYGPWGRPDMACFTFTRNILDSKPIELFNNGKMLRDFTYIDDVVNGVAACLFKPAAPSASWNSAAPDPSISSAPYHIYNIGNNKPVELEYFVSVLEKALGKKALRKYLPMQQGDVQATFAEIEDFTQAVGFIPKTSLEQGLPLFVDWFRKYYHK
ncbi:MAG: NAD-dependent epimerase [Deltaproteobacteria bacterium]|jgi:UDP-glucuronate 4-epimerase|nr:NAD-dependent epimerase [Deltaproteobacteria bacterium]